MTDQNVFENESKNVNGNFDATDISDLIRLHDPKLIESFQMMNKKPKV